MKYSLITGAKFEFGAEKSSYPDKNKIALLEFLSIFEIIDFDSSAAAEYGRVRCHREQKGRIIGPLDMLVAAQGLSRDLILVTNNTRDFERITGLKLENWVK